MYGVKTFPHLYAIITVNIKAKIWNGRYKGTKSANIKNKK